MSDSELSDGEASGVPEPQQEPPPWTGGKNAVTAALTGDTSFSLERRAQAQAKGFAGHLNSIFTGFIDNVVMPTWRSSKGAATIDVLRPTTSHLSQDHLLRVSSRPTELHVQRAPSTGDPIVRRVPKFLLARARLKPPNEAKRPRQRPGAQGDASDLVARAGARLKMSRYWTIGDPDPEGWLWRKDPPGQFSIGAVYDVDYQQLAPHCRIAIGDTVRIRVAPDPAIRLRGAWNIPNTPMQVSGHFECPMDNLRRFWEPPSRLSLRLHYAVGSGVHIAPDGLDVDTKFRPGGKESSTVVHCAGSVRVPRELPIPEGDPMFEVDLRRLGVKTSW
ncbi:unnamed protein product [Pedinophyceae sp. YPF-701]|nr:unnamed protein product [Pedinophyceae sp. YPF-701]